jgi:hypothetical protein
MKIGSSAKMTIRQISNLIFIGRNDLFTAVEAVVSGLSKIDTSLSLMVRYCSA